MIGAMLQKPVISGWPLFSSCLAEPCFYQAAAGNRTSVHHHPFPANLLYETPCQGMVAEFAHKQSGKENALTAQAQIIQPRLSDYFSPVTG